MFCFFVVMACWICPPGGHSHIAPMNAEQTLHKRGKSMPPTCHLPTHVFPKSTLTDTHKQVRLDRPANHAQYLAACKKLPAKRQIEAEMMRALISAYQRSAKQPSRQARS